MMSVYSHCFFYILVCFSLIFDNFLSQGQGVASGPCVCDLTAESCDLNCCCDSDCSASDVQSFSICLANTITYSQRKCVYQSVIFKANLPPPYSNEIVNNSFCVTSDSYTTYNYYVKAYPIDSYPIFDRLANSLGGFQSNSYTPIPSFTLANYTSGRPIYVVYDATRSLGNLSLPKPMLDSFCNDLNTAVFARSDNFACYRRITNLSTSCTTSLPLGSSRYTTGFKFVSNPPDLNRTIFNSSTNTTSSPPLISLNVTCVNATGGSSDTCPSPSFTAPNCNNVLSEVNYVVYYDAFGGIISALANVKLTSINATDTFLTQRFSISFVSIVTGNPTVVASRSGNPGYLFSKPVIAARTNQNGNLELVQWDTPSGGSCSSSSRISVLFGVNQRSGCLLSLPQDFAADCTTLEGTILTALRSRSYQPTSQFKIGIYGNSTVQDSSGWVTILEDNISSKPTGGSKLCSNIILGANIEILYSRTGTLRYPQNQIVGVRYNYQRGDLRYLCTSSFCNDTAPQTAEISVSLNYIDTSVTANPRVTQNPPYYSRLPFDFFYLFFG